MKTFLITILNILGLVEAGLSQPACANSKIETAIVQRPTELQMILTKSCEEVEITWKGHSQQAYIINAAYTDTSGPNILAVPGVIMCDKEYNCSVLLSLKPGLTLTWNIQAVETVDHRTFYSYPLRGEVAACNEQLIVESGKPLESASTVKENNTFNNRLTVFPNPVTGELTINWTSEYKGAAKLTILDAAGKPVKSMTVTKAQLNYSDKLNVNTFSAGLYYLHITMQSGKSVSTKFIKK